MSTQVQAVEKTESKATSGKAKSAPKAKGAEKAKGASKPEAFVSFKAGKALRAAAKLKRAKPKTKAPADVLTRLRELHRARVQSVRGKYAIPGNSNTVEEFLRDRHAEAEHEMKKGAA